MPNSNSSESNPEASQAQNPFRAPDSIAVEIIKLNATNSNLERRLFLPIFRALIAFVSLVIFPLFVVPAFTKTFEEFAISLPAVSLLVIALSNRMIQLWFVAVPIIVIVLVLAEVCLWQMKNANHRFLAAILGCIYWLLILLLLTALIAGILIPINAIAGGLNAVILIAQ